MNTESVKALVDALIRLYATIFVYLAKAKQYFEQSKASLSPRLAMCLGITYVFYRTRVEGLG